MKVPGSVASVALGLLCALNLNADVVTGLQGYYEFEADFSTTVGSVDGTGLNGAVAGATGGIVGNAMHLRSTGGTANEHMNLAIGFGGANLLGDNFTISAWYNLDDPPAGSSTNRYFVFESQNNFDVSYGIRDLGVGRPGINDGQVFTGNNTNIGVTDAGVGGWHHVLQTYNSDGTTTSIETFIDGLSVGTLTPTTSSIADTGLNFGAARNSQTNRGFDGLIDEVALWNRTLTSTDIQEVYNAGLNGQSLTAVPEPTMLGMIGGVAVVALLRRRRV